jgi:hypothetical protein
MARVSRAELAVMQAMDARFVLLKFADYAKPDPTFEAISSKHTSRWHARVLSCEFELLINGPKFYDTRLKRGGGGGIDLVMHLFQIDFKRAVERLRTMRDGDA